MDFENINNSIEELVNLSYRSKRRRPTWSSSEENNSNASELDEHNFLTSESDDSNITESLSSLDFDTDLENQDQKWQLITKTSPLEHEHIQDTELLITNINCDDPLSLYSLYLSDSILQLMVQETNRYAIQCTINNKIRDQQCWKSVTISEMKNFIGILLIMGITRVPDIKLYWSKNSIYTNICIKEAMPRNRFLAILRYLHFNDNTVNKTKDPLNKLKNIMKELVSSFKNTVKPGKKIVIKENMIPLRDRLCFYQYIQGKRHKCRIQLNKLCLIGGYTYDFDVYIEKNTSSSTKGHSYDIAMKLMDGLLFENRTLYTDKYYSSVPLAQELLQKKTYFCGLVKSNKMFLPLEVKTKQKHGEIIRMQNHCGVKFFKWTDKKTVCMLTTVKNHMCSLIERNPGNIKFDLVLDYNRAKKSVDIDDQMTSYYSCLRKTKWYTKIIIQLICVTAIINAYYIHKKWGTYKLSMLKFRELLINKLLGTKEILETEIPENRPHFIETYKGPARKVRKRCRECYRKLSEQKGASIATKEAKRVKTFCGLCDNQPPLCLPCFKEIHENK